MPRFRGVILDLDGVVVNSEPLHLESFNTILAKQHVRITKEQWRDHYTGHGDAQIWALISRKYGLSIANPREERHRTYHVIAKERLLVVRGLHDFLAFLESRGVKAIIATNGSAENVLLEVQIAHVEHLPRVTKMMVEHPKPAPDLFLLAVERLDLSPKTCIAIDDSPTGIIAAKSAGIAAIGMMTTVGEHALHDAGADFVVRDFVELLEKYRELF